MAIPCDEHLVNRYFEHSGPHVRDPSRYDLHEGGEIGGRNRAIDVTEGALVLHLAGGLDEARHGDAVERGRQADAAHAGGFELGDRERPALDAGHEVDRLGDRRAHRAHRGTGRPGAISTSAPTFSKACSRSPASRPATSSPLSTT